MHTFQIEQCGRYRAQINIPFNGGTYVHYFDELGDDLRNWVKEVAEPGQTLTIYDESQGIRVEKGRVTTPRKVIEITEEHVR